MDYRVQERGRRTSQGSKMKPNLQASRLMSDSTGYDINPFVKEILKTSSTPKFLEGKTAN